MKESHASYQLKHEKEIMLLNHFFDPSHLYKNNIKSVRHMFLFSLILSEVKVISLRLRLLLLFFLLVSHLIAGCRWRKTFFSRICFPLKIISRSGQLSKINSPGNTRLLVASTFLARFSWRRLMVPASTGKLFPGTELNMNIKLPESPTLSFIVPFDEYTSPVSLEYYLSQSKTAIM